MKVKDVKRGVKNMSGKIIINIILLFIPSYLYVPQHKTGVKQPVREHNRRLLQG